jgi:hypothetical protein
VLAVARDDIGLLTRRALSMWPMSAGGVRAMVFRRARRLMDGSVLLMLVLCLVALIAIR